VDSSSPQDDDRLRKMRRETLRARLIENFEAVQAKTRAFVSFPEIAKHWAPHRAELTLKAAKAAAIEDLMEAAYDGHFPSMLFLRERTGVEYVPEVCENWRQWCEEHSLPDEHHQDGGSACLDPAMLNEMRGMSGLRDLRDRYLLDQVAPFLWIASEVAASFLRKRGVPDALRNAPKASEPDANQALEEAARMLEGRHTNETYRKANRTAAKLIRDMKKPD
jgi:hypothetical protein